MVPLYKPLGGGIFDQEEGDNPPCSGCGGSGKCRECMGMGKYGPDFRECIACMGTGRCPDCGGRGEAGFPRGL